MLKVYRGIAAKNYENTFFREFAINLSNLFEKYKVEALLIGNPECTVETRLQIDALLVTPKAICIIDFKNFGGTIQLPRVKDFDLGRWTNEQGHYVKGGSCLNPYIQLKNQKKRFFDVARKHIESRLAEGDRFNPAHTLRVVCFQKHVQIKRSIPPKEEINFQIFHKGNYLEKIKDIMDINDHGVKISSNSHDLFLRFFEAEPFDLQESYVEVTEPPTATDRLHLDDLKADQNAALADFDAFLKDPNLSAYILSGTASSGKSHLIPFLKDMSFAAGITQVEILAPSSRVANSLMNRFEDAKSMYSYIYGGNRVSEHEEEQQREPLNVVSAPLEIVPLKASDDEPNCLYIVDESQLISDSYHKSPDVRFGSGHLLKDFLKFLDVESTRRKVVFIGDNYQISLGKANESPLSPEYLKGNYQLASRAFELNDKPEDNPILKNSLQCADAIRNNLFNRLNFSFEKEFQLLDKNKVGDTIRQNLNNLENFKFLSYTNEEANKVNLWIKHTILKTGDDLAVGDLLVLNNNIRVEDAENPFSKPQRLLNGQFLVVVAHNGQEKEIVSIKGGQKTEIVFRTIEATTVGKTDRVKILSLENYRQNPKGELSQEETTAIRILIHREIAEQEKLRPYENSNHRRALENSGAYINLKRKLTELNDRLASGEKVKTKITEIEGEIKRMDKVEYRNHINQLEQELSTDPSSRYYQLKNLAFLKYGWALNVHKAMSYKWNNVIFNVDWHGGQANYSYFKWLYTGLTRAKAKCYLLNYQEINPLQNILYQDNAASQGAMSNYYAIIAADRELTQPEKDIARKLSVLESDYCSLKVGLFQIITEKIRHHDISIKAIEHPNFQQVYSLANETQQVKIRFYYDGKGRIKAPTIQSGNNDTFNKHTLEILNANRTLSDFSFVHDGWRREFYTLLGAKLDKNRHSILSIMQTAYKDAVSFRGHNDERLDMEINYNATGFITSIAAKKYTQKEFWEEIKESIQDLTWSTN